MLYTGTRGKEAVSSAYAIKKGLCADGGLFFPEEFPSFTKEELISLSAKPYHERAAYVLSKFLTDYTADELLADCAEAYKSFSPSPAPVYKLDGKNRILELWHGPTCAFKDMALQLMPKLLSRALKKTGEKNTAYILVATSGDTGKAALEGFKDVPQTKIAVFYPVHGVSRIQKLQMATQEGKNVLVCSVQGNFDDAQSEVKRIFSDKALSEELEGNGYILSSANSINWGRLVPQIAYYVSAYCDLIGDGSVKSGDEVDVCVPTGNFGNILACYIAKRCGVPFGKLLCASNCNNVLTDFFENGTYNRNRPFHTTISPSMDILISSNLERLLYSVCGAEKTAGYMKSLSKEGCYTLEKEEFAAIKESFAGMYSDEEQTKARIKATFESSGYLIDTHTAVALDCAMRYEEKNPSDRIMLTVSTASPYKFSSSVLDALGREVSADEFENITLLSAYTKTEIPHSLASLRSKKVRFDPENSIKREEMAEKIKK